MLPVVPPGASDDATCGAVRRAVGHRAAARHHPEIRVLALTMHGDAGAERQGLGPPVPKALTRRAREHGPVGTS